MAAEILRLAQLPVGWHQNGPAEAEEIVQQIVKARRAQTPSLLDQLSENGKGLPSFEQHMEEAWRELEERVNEQDEASSDTEVARVGKYIVS